MHRRFRRTEGRTSKRPWFPFWKGTVLALAFAVVTSGFGRASAGSILREVFFDLSGVTLGELTNAPAYPGSPGLVESLNDFFETPTDQFDNYGQRVHGYIVPPVSGSYTFWIASDDNGALLLSTDETPARARQIAQVPEWTGSREWGKYPSQRSAPITLQANKPYYISALMKEGGGGDNLAVRWRRPDGVDEGPIPATYLLPWGTAFTPPAITEHPTNTTVVEGQIAVFVVKVSNVDPVSAQWARNGLPVPNGTGLVLNYGPVTLDDHGASFGATLTNRIGSTNSLTAVLSVTPDITRPVLISGINLGGGRIQLTFSEPLEATSAEQESNYTVSGGVTVTTATLDSDPRTVTLTVSPLTFDRNYTVTVRGLRDRARTPNLIEAESSVTFLALELVSQGIGVAGGSIVRLGNGAFQVTGGGQGSGGTGDEFQYAWEQRIGDFDVRVRVDSFLVTDPYVQAGLMARSSLNTNATYAAVFTSSAQVGCYFESRTTVGGRATMAAPRGGFPNNGPYTWLRLQRVGTILTGHASFDGQVWTRLGSASVVLGSPVYLGLVASGRQSATPTTVRFLEYGPAVNPTAGVAVIDREPLGPTTRRTGVIISEILYHPRPPAGITGNLEFIELYNAGPVFVDLGGWRIGGGVEFTFPPGYRLEAGAFVTVAADPAAVQSVYPITGVLGPFSGSLNNAGEALMVYDSFGALKLEMEYSPEAPWPASADGGGHSLILARPSLGLENPRAWSASEVVGGSPGMPDAIRPTPWRGVVINEFLAHTDDPQLDFIELFNRNRTEVVLDGCILTDDPGTNRFRIPSGTRIPARGHLVFDEEELGFRLDAAGEQIFLISPDGSRVIDAIRFGGQEGGVSSGRTPDGAERIRRLVQPTPGSANTRWRPESIVINELMYKPISRDDSDEFLELHNRSASSVDLSGWRFTDGIDFEIPTGTTIPAQGFLVVARDAARIRSNHPTLNSSQVVGNYQGSLANRGERVALSMPDDLVTTNRFGDQETNRIYITVAEAEYREMDRWHQWSNAGGSSLELTDPEADPLEASNWADSDESSKAPWTTISFTGNLDHGNENYPPNRFQMGLMGAGECLVDDVEFFRTNGGNLLSNGGFEDGDSWEFAGNHEPSRIQTGGAFSGSRCLRLVALGDGDTGPNSVRTSIGSPPIPTGQANIRARVRWVRGWPEILMRTRGNWIEAYGRLTVPANLGSPGQPNSRRVSNAGPVITEVRHSPVLPQANQPVTVTARVADPDGLATVLMRFRVDPSTTATTVTLRDDGVGADALAGDGIYSGTVPGRASGSLVAFRVEATDSGSPAANRVFPPTYPESECLIRWGDASPVGSFAHYHLWSTQATEDARNSSYGLNNRYRDATLVYGDFRVIYGAGFRDKGSPFHGGYGDFAVTVPLDDLLLGAEDRVLALTGNGDTEETGMRTQVANWIASRLGIPHLHSHYIRLYRNGGQYSNVMEDLEQPNNSFAEGFFPSVDEGDLYKIAVWFEFADNDRGFDARGATLERFNSPGLGLKPARYRWNWQTRGWLGSANNLTNIFNMVTAANTTSDFGNRMRAVGDIEQWMRVFAFNRICGNWDSWTFSGGQNMYIYFQPGEKAKLLPWDIDFVLGRGNGPTDPLGGGSFGGSSHDPVANALYNEPSFRRALFRAYLDAINGPLQPQSYQPQLDARKAVLQRNGFTVGSSGDLRDPRPIAAYIDARRNYLMNQINAANRSFAITTSGGADFTATQPTVNLSGTAPFAVADIEVNGVVYPVRWSDQTTFNLVIPLGAGANLLNLVGRDRQGAAVPGATDTITVNYSGSVPRPEDFIVINEIQYDGLQTGSSFVELHNRSTTVPFDLSGYVLEGLGYTFPSNAIVAPNSFLVLARDRTAFALAYGNTVNVFDEFPGSLDNGGETLSLVRPGSTAAEARVISAVRYDDDAPWSAAAAGQGPSLQLVDPALGSSRLANWHATAVGDPNQVTPGRANAGRSTLAAFPTLWINEVLPDGVNGVLDNHGEREPYIEIYNPGPDPVDLSPYFLTDSYADPTRWAFPSSLPPLGAGQFLVIWADGEPQESTATVPHTRFRLHPTTGSVALVRQQGGPVPLGVLDYINYVQVPTGRSMGSYPDGEPRGRRTFHHVTPGLPNNPVFPPVSVVINELMASNTRTLVNPINGRRDDWFELHNAGTTTVDLTGYFLSDNLANPRQFQIPPGFVIAPGGFLLVWADDETQGNTNGSTQLHVSFRLSAGGEQLGLFAPDGELVDGVTFGAQVSDVSLGRFPDGAPGDMTALEQPTPGEPNLLAGGNRPPVIQAIPALTVAEMQTLQHRVVATDEAGQTVRYSLGADAPPGATIDEGTGALAWTPGEVEGPGVYLFTVRATDNGSPARTAAGQVRVTVSEVNRAPVVPPVVDRTVDERSVMTFRIAAEDPDLPANRLAFALEGAAPQGLQLDSDTGVVTWIPSEAQGPGAYGVQVRVTDDGQPPASSTVTFTITVREVNNPPDIAEIQPQAVDEGSPFELTVSAMDQDTPPATIEYSLEGNLPDGIRIDRATGVIRWVPEEHQGPGNYVLVVRATETTGERLSSARSFGLAVREANSPPRLAALSDLSAQGGGEVRFQALASDSDLPAQALIFSLEGVVPPGASVDSQTGEFVWSIPADAVASTQEFRLRVSDSGPGALSDEVSFRVTVVPQVRVVIDEIMYRPTVPNTEYVELKNASAVTSWDISGFRLEGESLSFTFPAGTVMAPGAMVVVVRNPAAFTAVHGSPARVLGPWSGTLGTSGDLLRLVRPGPPDQWISPVRFGNTFPWPAAANGGGASLQLMDDRWNPARVANWSGASVYSGPRELVTLTNLWRYHQSGPLNASWKDGSFDDGSWPQGRGVLFAEDAALPAPKNTPLTLGQNTYYFRTAFELPSVPAGASLKLTTLIDDGAVFYLNGREVYRQNIPDGVAVDFNTIASVTVGDAALTGPFVIAAGDLRPGMNVFAVEVHQASVDSSDLVMACRLELEGGNLPGMTPGASNNVAAERLEFPPVWINEVLPQNATGATDRAGEREPWIELVNQGSTPVDVGGWTLSNLTLIPGMWTFPPGTVIPARGFLVVIADGEASESSVPDELHTGFRLTAGSGSVFLSRPTGAGFEVADFMDYSGLAADESWVAIPDGQPFRRQRTPRPTPGAANATAEPNREPQLDAIGAKTVDEETRLTFQARAVDPDAGQTLRFTLGGDLRSGMALDERSGQFTWTPHEADGPGVYQVVIRVTDNGTPPKSAEESVSVTVTEVNRPPMLVDVPQQSVQVGDSLTLNVQASDADFPSQNLFFAAEGAPSGLVLGRLTGRLEWSPSAADVGTWQFLVRVTDSGVPPQSDAVTLVVVVGGAGISLGTQTEADGSLRLVWPSELGVTYRVESSASLDGGWSELESILGTGSALSYPVPTEPPGPRFFRVQAE